MEIIILSLLPSAVLLVIILVVRKLSKRKVFLPSGKPVPKSGALWCMTPNQLVKEYSKTDLEWLKRYVMRKIGNANPNDFSLWSKTSRNIHIALYGWAQG